MSNSSEAGFDTDSPALDDVFELYGPVDVEAFIEAQFKDALRGEEDMYSVNHGETPTVRSKMEVVDGPAPTPATLHSFEFSFGNDTQINLHPTFPLSHQEEEQSNRLICSRCRENMDRDDLENFCASNKIMTTREAQQKTTGCDGGIELKGTHDQ